MRLIDADAPTIEPDGDLISRQDAIYELEHIMGDHPLQGYEDEQLLINALESLPSAQPNGDLISRQDAIDGYVWIIRKNTKIRR